MKDKNKIFLCIAVVVIILIVAGAVTGAVIVKNRSAKSERILGVWWWDNRLDESYLTFASEQGVNEIYYYTSSFNEKTSAFLQNAAELGIRVYWLTGKYEWIEDSGPLYEKIEEFTEFQNTAEYPFSGIHFDIEPHQHPDFERERERLIASFVELVYGLKSAYPDLMLEYDIPFWLDDEISLNGETKPAYAHIIDASSGVTVMSYRDSAEAILNCASEEISYAVSVGKPLNLSVETGENDDDIVTFFEEGALYMQEQLNLVKENLPDSFGIAIHHIRSWFELKK